MKKKTTSILWLDFCQLDLAISNLIVSLNKFEKKILELQIIYM